MSTREVSLSFPSDDLPSIAETAGTSSTSSTQWGPGALTGKALKAIGETSLDLLCRVAIRRRLAVIRQTIEKSPRILTEPLSVKEWQQRDAIYTDLDELCRVYCPTMALRREAAHLLQDIVTLISRFLSESSSDDNVELSLNPGLCRSTSLISAPMHILWVLLLSHIQCYHPYLLSGHGSSISVGEWTLRPLTEKETADEANVETEIGLGSTSRYPEPPSPNSMWTIMVTVEATQYQSVQNDLRIIKPLTAALRTWSLKITNSQRQQDRMVNETVFTKIMDIGPLSNEISTLCKESKVLVLGTAAVGKSTLLEHLAQEQSVHSCEVPAEVIISNTIASMQSILLDISPSELYYSASEEAKRNIEKLPLVDFSPQQLHVAGSMIRTLWRDPGIRKAALRQRAWQSDDMFVAPHSLAYFCDAVDRIFSPDYKPTFQDGLRSRLRTTGIHAKVNKSNTDLMRFFDTGGERSERKKWINVFGEVTALIFVVALSDYNRSADTDRVSRLGQSLVIFESLVNSRWFANSLITLIFNKCDVFAEELKIHPLEDWEPNYSGKTYDDACKYIETRFLNLVKEKNRAFRVHYTTAVDEKTMMDKSIIIRSEITQHRR